MNSTSIRIVPDFLAMNPATYQKNFSIAWSNFETYQKENLVKPSKKAKK